MRRPTLAALPGVLVALAACDHEPPPLPPVDVGVHRDSIDKWHDFRRNAVYGPTGWATLLGLWWINPGETTIGADSTSTIILPRDRAPRRVGSVFVGADSTWFVAARGVTVTRDTFKAPLAATRITSDLLPKAPVLKTGPLVISYIVREDRGVFRHAVRIKDTLNAARGAPPLRYFPTDIRWRVQARYRPVVGNDSLDIIGVLGTLTRMAHPGNIDFELDGRRHTLMVIREPEDHTDELFVMFTDSTNRRETYPATRYVWVAPPDSLGRTVIDFNKAFNPPCAFTKFATCPFPPRGNHLPLFVTAGEWNPNYGSVVAGR
jgi:hypothetical protein